MVRVGFRERVVLFEDAVLIPLLRPQRDAVLVLAVLCELPVPVPLPSPSVQRPRAKAESTMGCPDG